MPTYLCHGFRWYRNNVRVFTQFQDIENAAPDWVIRPGSSHAMIYRLYELFDFLPFAEDLVPATSAATAIASATSPTSPTSGAAGAVATSSDSQPRLQKKRSRARFLNKLSILKGGGSGSSSGSGSSNSTATAVSAPTPSGSAVTSPSTPAVPPNVYKTGELLSKSISASCGLLSDDEEPLPPPSRLEQPPIVPKIVLPPGSETIFLPPGVKPPAMPPPPSPLEEAKARVVHTDPDDPVLRNNDWAAICLLEEWDARADLVPTETLCSRPWAFVADYAVRIDLSGRVTDEMARYERWCNKLAPEYRPMGGGDGLASGFEDDPAADRAAVEAGFTPKPAPPRNPGWFQKLRDNMEFEGAIQWYIVVCEDEMRDFPAIDEEELVERIKFDKPETPAATDQKSD
ncbi:hypothetical protein HOO65_020943 [Ceratocystis lukuohia]|uniref:Uncharacterized protein n=2 Tax=Ceratocystis TaxID=5157 RepID=A0A0F8D4M0_CERFI|nr:hypothetical protein CFO_g35 [Ceratocystis platani]